MYSYKISMILLLVAIVIGMVMFFSGSTYASYMIYGDQDLLGTGRYNSDPTEGATLEGLAPNEVTYSSVVVYHTWPFKPDSSDFPGTDQIYVGSEQTAKHDGYSMFDGRQFGPQVLVLDYSALVPSGYKVDTLTLGIAADDFQQPRFGNFFEVYVNGYNQPALTNVINSLNQTGPQVQFFTVGVDPDFLIPDNKLFLIIDEGGDGADGWAIDYATIGVTTSPVPIPPSALLLMGGIIGLLVIRRNVKFR